jgi:inorganic pyrophosphatase
MDPHTGCGGDNDPLDVCDISDVLSPLGSIVKVKVLGVLAMIDEGETDWKIIAINVNDPLSEKMNDIGDVERVKPGLLSATIEWFRNYKIPDGKPKNKFAFNDTFKDKQFAIDVVKATHESWKHIMEGKVKNDKISLANTTDESSSSKISKDEADKIVSACEPKSCDNGLESNVHKVFFMDSNL